MFPTPANLVIVIFLFGFSRGVFGSLIECVFFNEGLELLFDIVADH